MGFIPYVAAGAGFFLIGATEAISSATSKSLPSPHSSFDSGHDSMPPPTPAAKQTPPRSPSSPSTATSIAVALFAFSSVANSLASLIDASDSRDSVGDALQLEVISIALLFLLHAILGLVFNFADSFPLPPSIPGVVCLFGFVEEFLLFYLQRKDPSGIENRYFDLLLVPILICVCSTVLELNDPQSNLPRLGRGIGLILQGTWFVQMGVSFFTSMTAHGCSVHEKSRGNFSVRCKGHSDYHRGRAIATLQFNCHLSFLAILATCVFSILRKGRGLRSDYTRYKPLSEEMQQIYQQTQFTLNSDNDEIGEQAAAGRQKDGLIATDVEVNGLVTTLAPEIHFVYMDYGIRNMSPSLMVLIDGNIVIECTA